MINVPPHYCLPYDKNITHLQKARDQLHLLKSEVTTHEIQGSQTIIRVLQGIIDLLEEPDKKNDHAM